MTTSAARTPLRVGGTASAPPASASLAAAPRRVTRRALLPTTPSRPTTTTATAATTTTTTPVRRATPKAKLNLNFSAAKARAPRTPPTTSITTTTATTTTPRVRSSARKPLRVVTNTPHAATPKVNMKKILHGVYAMVDVRMGADAAIDCSDAVARKLADMGATILKKKGGRLTHVVVSHFTPQWKEKVARWQSATTPVEVVSPLWVNACFTNKQRMKESAFFPVNKGFEVSATVQSTPGVLTRIVRSSSIGPRKKTAPATPARPSSALGRYSTGGAVSLAATPIGGSNTPAPASRAGNSTHKRRALSMEPMASDAILRLLENSTKKLLKQSSESDVHSAIAATTLDSATSTPVKNASREIKTTTPPLSVRLKAAIERRKSFASSTSLSSDLFPSQNIDAPCTKSSANAEGDSAVTENNSGVDEKDCEVDEKDSAAAEKASAAPEKDCVAESCSEGEEDEINHCSADLLSDQTSGISSGTNFSSSMSTPPPPSQESTSLITPVTSAKGEWACSICSCMNAKTRRICRGCKASRVAAKTSATDQTPTRRPLLRSAWTTPRQRPLSAKALALAGVSATPGVKSSSASSERTKLVPNTKTKLPLKRPRFSSSGDTDDGSIEGSNDIFTDERLGPSIPASKKQKTAVSASTKPPISTKKFVSQRAVIGITGVDSETRGIIECAVHGIDANMASEPGHRKARVVKSVDYAAGVTHLIVGKEIKRTIKVLFAIARGAWIVSEAWAFASLEQEKWLNEEDFEVAAFPSRQMRLEPEQRQVFRSLKFFVGSNIDPTREVLISLIQCAGGEIVNQISVADYCVCGDETLFRRATRTKIHGVPPKWVFDSIASLKLEDPQAYGLSSGEKKDGGVEEH